MTQYSRLTRQDNDDDEQVFSENIAQDVRPDGGQPLLSVRRELRVAAGSDCTTTYVTKHSNESWK